MKRLEGFKKMGFRRIMIIAAFIALFSAAAGAEDFRLGLIGAVEAPNENYEEAALLFGDQNNIYSGFYWEVMFDHFGFGMNYLTKFDHYDSEYPYGEADWFVNYQGSFDFRYHFFEWFFIDPFVEAGFGAAGQNRVAGYNYYGPDMLLSLFGQVGGGVALRLDDIHVGSRVLYRFYNDIPPVTDFQPVPLKDFQISIFAGFSF